MRIDQLTALGWDDYFAGHFAPHERDGYQPARVLSENRGFYSLDLGDGEILAKVSGRFRFDAVERDDYPAVGDWVAISHTGDAAQGQAVIQAVLPRRSKFSRKVAGEVTQEQIVAANVDTVFLVSGLDHDFNPGRIERYLVMAWESGATPVVVGNKADLCPDVPEKVAQLEDVALGVPVYPVSCATGEGLDDLAPYLAPGCTVALLGSSGVGKSSLINSLAGEGLREVGAVRTGDDRGRHTTTQRQLIRLPQGGLIIDTPGMRELQLWEADAGLGETFEDVESLATRCYYRDCQHDGEPGCAVREALEDGRLDERRYESYRKLQRELAYLARKENQLAQIAEKEKWKKINKEFRRRGNR